MQLLKTKEKLLWDEISLSNKEKAWLKNNKTVKVRVGEWPPYIYLEKNEPKGIAIDYIKLIALHNGFNVEFINKKEPFIKAINDLIKNKKIDLIPVITNKPIRQNNMLFTKNFINDARVIFTKENEKFIGSLDDLRGETLATVKGYTQNKILQERYPDIKLVYFDNDKDALRAVSTSRTTAYIGVVPVATYLINKDKLTNLKIVAPADIENSVNAMAIRNDWPELVSIINKTFEAMSPQMHDLIKQKSLSIKYEFGVSWTKIWAWLFTLFLASSIIIIILRNNNKKLNYLLNSSIEGVAIFKNGELIEANKPFLKLFKYDSINEVKGKSPFDLIYEKDKYLLQEKLKYSAEPYELNLRKSDNTIFPALVRGTKVSQNERISTFIDLTQLKKVQNELKILNKDLEKRIDDSIEEIRKKDKILAYQTKMAAMGEMINNIAHQWRQPLTDINATVMAIDLEFMQDKYESVKVEKYLQNIELQTRYMSNTIDNFKDYFMPNKEKDDFLISDALKKSLKIIEINFIKKNIEIEIEVKKDKLINGYLGEYIQVLITILNNSKDALLNTNEAQKKIHILINENLSIEDNADGIKEKDIERIFEPYFTTKHKKIGTGIGLYMAKMIIEDSMNGQLIATNTENGAKFTIII